MPPQSLLEWVLLEPPNDRSSLLVGELATGLDSCFRALRRLYSGFKAALTNLQLCGDCRLALHSLGSQSPIICQAPWSGIVHVCSARFVRTVLDIYLH